MGSEMIKEEVDEEEAEAAKRGLPFELGDTPVFLVELPASRGLLLPENAGCDDRSSSSLTSLPPPAPLGVLVPLKNGIIPKFIVTVT